MNFLKKLFGKEESSCCNVKIEEVTHPSKDSTGAEGKTNSPDNQDTSCNSK